MYKVKKEEAEDIFVVREPVRETTNNVSVGLSNGFPQISLKRARESHHSLRFLSSCTVRKLLVRNVYRQDCMF